MTDQLSEGTRAKSLDSQTIPVNRVEAAIWVYRMKLEKVSEEKKRDLESKLAIETSEFVAYQNAQARAHASGVISTGEAQTIYMALNRWDENELAVKIAVTQVLAEIVKKEITA